MDIQRNGIDPARLRLHREAAQMRQVDVAKALNISRARYCNYEKGRRPVPLGIAAELAALLHFRIEDVLSG